MLSYSLAVASLYIVAGALGDRYGRWPLFVVGVAGFAVASALAGSPRTPSCWCRPGAAGRRRRAADHQQPGAAAGDLRRGQRPRGRAVDGVERDRHDDRPAAGRPARAVRVVALDLLHQPAGAGVALVLAVAGRSPRSGCRRSRGRCSCSARRRSPITFGDAHLRADRGRAGGVRHRCSRRSGCRSPASCLLIVTERRSADPLLPLELLRDAGLPGRQPLHLLVYAALGGSTFYLALYLQSAAVGYDAARASLIFLPISPSCSSWPPASAGWPTATGRGAS